MPTRRWLLVSAAIIFILLSLIHEEQSSELNASTATAVITATADFGTPSAQRAPVPDARI